MNYKEIIKAGAIGDAFGYQVEFKNMKQIAALYGSEGIRYELSHEKCASDDTQMTLFLWEAVNRYIKDNAHFDLNDFIKEAHHSFMDWHQTQTTHYSIFNTSGLLSREELFKRQAPGNTCLSALSNSSPRSISRKINDSKGCGSVMRIAPLLILKKHYQLSSEQLFELSVHQAAITHGNDEGMSATGFFTVLLDELANGKSFPPAYEHSLVITKKTKFNNFIKYIEKVYQLSQDIKLLTQNNLENAVGSGWIADEAVGMAMYCAIKSRSFKECLELSTNHSGDSDSTASMAAQLYVAKNGLGDILFKTDLDDTIEFLDN